MTREQQKKKTAELLREMTCAPRAHYAEQSHSQFTSREESNRIANCLQIVVSYYNLRSAGGATNLRLASGFAREFQSTLPVGGATRILPRGRNRRSISIHAPRGGSDVPTPDVRADILHFNPRSPWGERRGAAAEGAAEGPISIHAPRGGSDRALCIVASMR